MRVITGIARGRRLKAVKGMKTRPTTDRVKESLFSILGPVIPDADFLDLFSGTGGIAIEALSRGANLAVLVERDRRALAVIRENLQATRLEGKATVMGTDVHRAVAALGQQGHAFDVVFMDPPYELMVIPDLLQQIQTKSLLAPEGIAVCEHGSDTDLPETVDALRLVRKQVYGDTQMDFYRFGSPA